MKSVIVLIHGAWLSPWSWTRFGERYKAKGVEVLAPAWPYHDRSIEVLQTMPDPRLAHLALRDIVRHYAAIVQAIPDPPLLIGHSFGGLFVQLLLAQGFGRAGVAIAPVAPFGVTPHLTGLFRALPAVTTFGSWRRIVRMSWETFATNFAQTLPVSELDLEYRAQIVPTPGRLYWQALLGAGSRVRYRNADRPPLLFISGEADRIVPLTTVRANYRKQRVAASRTDFKSFPGRSHYLCNEPGWEEVADFAFEWATQGDEPAS